MTDIIKNRSDYLAHLERRNKALKRAFSDEKYLLAKRAADTVFAHWRTSQWTDEAARVEYVAAAEAAQAAYSAAVNLQLDPVVFDGYTPIPNSTGSTGGDWFAERS